MKPDVPYAHWKVCIQAILEQIPIQLTLPFRRKTRYLFCYCMAVADEDGQTLNFKGEVAGQPASPVAFQELNRFGKKNWGDIRFEGYAAAIHTGQTDKLVLFGPQHEIAFGRSVLVDTHEVKPDQVISCVTRNSTITNATVMRRFLRVNWIPAQWVRMCSSAYHLRSPILAFDGCLLVRHMPAESFLFAYYDRNTTDGKAKRAALRKRLTDMFADGLTERLVDEIQGSHDSVIDYVNYDRPADG